MNTDYIKLILTPASHMAQSVSENEYTLQEMQKAVGGFIEHLPLTGFSFPAALIIDEEGKLSGKKKNDAATSLAREHSGIAPSDYIAGTALICREEGDGLYPLTDAQYQEIACVS